MRKNHVLVVVKPGFVNLVGEFCRIFKENGYTIVKTKVKRLTENEAKSLYKIHKKEEWYKPLCDYMSSDLTLGLLFKSDDKEPLKKMAEVKDKVREKFGESDMRNVMHSSDSYDHMLDEQCIYFG